MNSDAERHPDADVLAAFIEGRLEPHVRSIVSAHVERCKECLTIVGETARLERELEDDAEEEPSTARVQTRRRLWPVLSFAALLVIVVAAGVVVVRERKSRDALSPLTRSVAALRYRPVEARLEGFAYAPLPIRRAGEVRPELDPALLRARGAAADLLDGARDEGNAEQQHVAGVAALIAGYPGQAEKLLEKAVALDPSSERFWNDLAAARYESWKENEGGDSRLLIDALVAVDRALHLRETSAAALYNRALILQALDQREQALRAFRQYRSIDPGTPWAKEAAQREERLAARSESWRDSGVQRLRRAMRDRDGAAVASIVATFPRESRAWGESIFLAEWAEGSGEGLAIARAVAVALRERTGEALLGDALTAIDAAAVSPSRTAALREGHRLYLAAGLRYKNRDVTGATALFATAAAAFRRGGSPMAAVADYYFASCQYDLNHSDEALPRIDRVLERIPAQYKALRAQLLWERGTILTRAGRVNEALAAQMESLRIFTFLGETEHIAFLSTAAAASLAILGRADEAWRMRNDAFRLNAVIGNQENEQIALDTAARTEALARRWDRTYSLLTLALEPALRINPRVTTSSLLWRAVASARLELPGIARELKDAQQIAASIPDAALRRSAEGDVLFIRGMLARRIDPRGATRFLTEFIAHSQERNDEFLLAEAYLERAEAERTLGENAAAIADLTETLRRLKNRRNDRGESRDDYRDAFFSTADAAQRELVDLLDRQGNEAAAFASLMSEAARESNPATVTPQGVLLASYVVLNDRIVIFAVDEKGLHAFHSMASGVEVGRTAVELNTLIDAGRDDEAQVVARRLGRWLIEPIEDMLRSNRTLVVVPDGVLSGVPFAALPLHDGTPLIQSTALITSPNVGMRSSKKAAGPEYALVVGNPRLDRQTFPNFPDLGAAELEARDIAASLDVPPLIGAAATKAAVLEQIRHATLAHFATHAVVKDTDPSQSLLLLGPSGSDAGALYLNEIEQLHLDSVRVVVLAGCRTAASTSASGNASSLARAFLHAGAWNVVATLWDVDDRVGRRFSLSFHYMLHAGTSPANAVRQVQLAMLNSSDPNEHRLAAWSGFQVHSNAWAQ